MEGVFAVIGVFGCIPLIVWIVSHYRTKTRAKAAELVNALINKDKEVTPEIIKSIGFVPARAHGDLRTALILGAIGIAMFIFSQLAPVDEGAEAISGLASFPLLIGLAYFTFWYFVSRKEEN